MSTASLTFILFAGATLLVYWLLPGRVRWVALLAASLLFYAWGDGWYLPFLGFGILSTYAAARWMQAHADRDAAALAAAGAELSREERKARRAAGKRIRRRALILCLVLNFAVLAVLKYTGFALSVAGSIGRLFGAGDIRTPTLLLPLGISFYTFRSAAYVIDVYRGKAQAQRNIARYALFVSFFPAVVQGPICRYNDLMPALTEPHSLTWEDSTAGLVRVAWGYFKKVAVADTALVAVRAIVQKPDELRGAYAAVLILLYSLVIYGDFTGGMDISLGLARMMGIRLTENFNRPFSARSTEEYWKRWHITMGSWFTDYVFYPLSVSKPMQKLSKWGRAHLGRWLGMRLPVWVATTLTWFLTGLWHGASWNFVVWGLLNGLVILISNELRPAYAAFHRRFPRLTASSAYGGFCALRTFLLMGAIRSLDCYRDVGVTFRAFGSIFTSPASWRDLFCGGAVSRLGLSVPVWVFLGLAALLFWLVGRQGKSRCSGWLFASRNGWSAARLCCGRYALC
ncbi:MAG: MBOAT family protein [Oscillospiraceae bacterium]|nr:MAG: MBOAT family protein [Oscillospiraceae bacterium]